MLRFTLGELHDVFSSSQAAFQKIFKIASARNRVSWDMSLYTEYARVE